MIRFASHHLDQWLKSVNRKPLVLRGARQVGKTWIVRDFSKKNHLNLIELNLEKYPALVDLFRENNPKEVLKNIEAALAIQIDPKTACLFLDEIQAAPELFQKLRWFKEDMPEIPVIAAGSLLEFALNKYQHSMPVGRITYFYLEPLSFFEFVLASGNEALYRKLLELKMTEPMPPSLHEKCMAHYREYCLIGGMPEVVEAWIGTQDLKQCAKIQKDLLATYRDDFYKYGGDIDARLLDKIVLSAAEQVGNKFVYSRVDQAIQAPIIKKALSMLFQAKVCSKVVHTSGNGVPLGAESNEKFFKALLLDIGLISVALGLSSITPLKLQEASFSNRGGLAEQFVGQQLRAAQSPLNDPQLFYWQRTGGRLGEIDFIMQYGDLVLPIEVKSGASGSMKSLHLFLAEKKRSFAVRFDTNLPTIEGLSLKATSGEPVNYRLLSLPLYLAEHIETFISQVWE